MPRLFARLTVALLVVAGIAMSALPAEAGSRELKATGLIGETTNGYLGVVDPSASADLRAEMEQINRGRRDHYIGVSEQTGRPLSEVEAVAGARLRESADAGEWIQNAAGEWVQKR